MGTRRRLLLAAAGVPVLAVAVLGVEVELARRGRNLDDVELTHPDAAATTAVWLGDSTAYGIGVTDGDDGVAGRVARARDERVEMLAVSGDTIAEMLRYQVPKVAALEPDRIYVSIGANDVTHLTSKEAFASSYRALLRALPEDVDVVALGVPDMGAPPRLLQPLRTIAGFRGRQLDAIARDAVADAKVDRSGVTTYVDIAGPTGPSFRDDPDRYFAADRYHPSAAGYELWADAVLAAVDE